MRFGKSAAEAEKDNRGGSGGDFIKYLKDGDVTFRLLEDPDDWTYWWEHFDPGGYSFPCAREKPEDPIENCPGCSSDNERMSKVTRRIGFNVLQSYNGQDYVNVYKVANAVADKLKNRFTRFGTVTDRDYTITRYKTSGDRYDFDVDGGMPSPIDPSKHELKDIEAMLAVTYEEKWGDWQYNSAPARTAKPTIAPAPAKVESDEPPFEPKAEKVYREEELRKMDHGELLVMIKDDMGLTPPATLTSTDGVVNWLMEINS